MKKYSQLIMHSGNDAISQIMDISVLGTLTGLPVHIHAEGLRGTGKTTVMRAYKEVLPKICRIKGCLYNCDPVKPHCPEHRHMDREEIQKLGTEFIDMPFLEISASAKKATVVGSIDLEKLTSRKVPEAALLLGTIPRAHRGIMFIDEINRVADIAPEIADVLLDVMGTKPGRIQIEEAGLPIVEIPVQVSVWAASNPDEDPGPLEDIRRQLSDRFDFSVNVERPSDANIIKSILDDQAVGLGNANTEKKLWMFSETRKIVDNYNVSNQLKSLLANLYVEFGLESLRGVEAALTGAQIRGALLKRNPDYDDLIFTARYALRHRVDSKSLCGILSYIEQNKNKLDIAEDADKAVCAGSKSVAIEEHKGKTASADSRTGKSSFNLLEKLLRRLSNRMGQGKDSGKTNITSGGDPKDMNIKAPPQKALAIKELDINEYVKTEEELF